MSVTIERISALLIKAERTDNEHEAAAYLMKAQSLATLASIDLAAARARKLATETPDEPITRTVSIGEKGKRANTHLVALFVVIAHNNFTMVDVATDSTYVVAYGMPQDLDSTHTLFASLSVQMATSAQQYLEAGQWKAETYRVRSRTTGLTRHQTFHQADSTRSVLPRVCGHTQRSPAGGSRGSDQAARSECRRYLRCLVLRNTEKEVKSFHRRTSDARGRWGGYRGSVNGKSGSAAGAGRTAAQRARLKASDELPGGPRALPR
jgi:hypothetical protein